ncbi:hypothetical protein [Oceanobacillus neutriphilus]|uniref:Integral membrane protein n=1 Tax=Oceanobacillus neutriphilus TaxID=531815 RepID=A0ABQ2P0L6_9BACI|nr:hypothetical protein [Oceanobacillus neutriphilus]GGP15236.1 hypothetical protein GCM10011346_42440 [Oceanobacillus neutriphilus]
MSDKKKLFGVGSEPEEDNPEVNQQPFNPDIKKEKVFGSQVKEEGILEKQTAFGTQHTAADENKQGKLANIKLVFSLQNKLFWVSAYLLAIIYLIISDRDILQFHFPTIPHIAMTVLFPFSVLIIGSIAIRLRNMMPGVYYWLYPTYRRSPNINSILFLVIWYAMKVMFYYFIWATSFLWGILGIIFAVINARKIEK